MELSEALPILPRSPRFRDLNLRKCDDHICDRDHAPGKCPLAVPGPDRYTGFDAHFDTPEKLEMKLRTGGLLKPPSPNRFAWR
jgi:hypothetical protein